MLRKAAVDCSFEIPTALYVGTAGLFVGFIGVMWLGFATAELAVPMVIFATFIVCAFGIPALWVRMHPQRAVQATTWGRFLKEGTHTYTGHSTGRDATMQVMMLPVLIFCWGVAAAAIVALAA